MNCQSYQERLLNLDLPDRPPGDLQVHLASCDECREWQRRLILLQDSVRQLPIPAALSRLDFLRKFLGDSVTDLAGSSPAGVAGGLPSMPLPAPTIPDFKRLIKTPPWTWYSFMAAAVVMGLAVAALKLWRHDEILPQSVELNPVIPRLVDGNRRLAHGADPNMRVEALADMADDLFVEAQHLARGSSPDDLTRVAQSFEKVVRHGVVAGARKLSPADRQRMLGSISDRLDRTAQEAERVALKSPAEMGAALRHIADVAREASRELK